MGGNTAIGSPQQIPNGKRGMGMSLELTVESIKPGCNDERRRLAAAGGCAPSWEPKARKPAAGGCAPSWEPKARKPAAGGCAPAW